MRTMLGHKEHYGLVDTVQAIEYDDDADADATAHRGFCIPTCSDRPWQPA
jgi:hypothetical protein